MVILPADAHRTRGAGAWVDVPVGLVSPGELGAELAAHLVARGFRVISALGDRSDRTVGLARDAGVEDVGDLDVLVREAGIVLSLVPPARALEVGESIGRAVQATGAAPIVVDANSVSPATVRMIAVRSGRESSFVDAGIVSTPPRDMAAARIYASGPAVEPFVEWGAAAGLDVRPLGTEIGRASALKMSYAALSKGLPAISTALLVAAQALGVADELMLELEHSQPDLVDRMRRQVPRVPAVAARWVGEMEELAATYAAIGLPPGLYEGAADVFRLVASSSLRTTPEAVDRGRSLVEIAEALAQALPGTRPTTRVLNPAAEAFHRAERRPLAARRPELAGARVGFVENGFAANALLHDELRAAVEARGGATSVEEKKYWRSLDPGQLERLVATADLVVGGLCNTPPSTAFGVEDAIALERAGIPTVVLAVAHYEELLGESATAGGMPDLRRLILPYPLDGLPEDEVRAIARRAAPAVVAALTDPAAAASVRIEA